MKIQGDSVVLPGTDWVRLCFDDLIPAGIRVRSTYEPDRPGTIGYEAGRDYRVDAAAGTIARLEGSRIPDYHNNPLCGQKNFDHHHFKWPDFANTPFFVFVDYQTGAESMLATSVDCAVTLTQTRRRLDAGGEFKIVAYGDSITAGCDATAPHLQFTSRYAAFLGRRFPQARIVLENGAIGGIGTAAGLQQLETKVLSRAPDLVLIGFGMNDHNVGGTPLAAFADNLAAMVTRIRERTRAEIILYSAFPPNPEWKFSSHQMQRYAAATRGVALTQACAYTDVYAVWERVLQRKDPSSLLGNNINHPNDFGHWLYTEALCALRF